LLVQLLLKGFPLNCIKSIQVLNLRLRKRGENKPPAIHALGLPRTHSQVEMSPANPLFYVLKLIKRTHRSPT
jgi:hypothetical protein